MDRTDRGFHKVASRDCHYGLRSDPGLFGCSHMDGGGCNDGVRVKAYCSLVSEAEETSMTRSGNRRAASDDYFLPSLHDQIGCGGNDAIRFKPHASLLREERD